MAQYITKSIGCFSKQSSRIFQSRLQCSTFIKEKTVHKPHEYQNQTADNAENMKPSFKELLDQSLKQTANDDIKPTFKELLDESLLMQFGRPNGKCVVGKVIEICNDDLYVDFGAKFEAVVKKPITNQQFYEKGSLVRLILNNFEMTGAFLGDPRHITLCEADAILVGPYIPPVEHQKRKEKNSKTQKK